MEALKSLINFLSYPQWSFTLSLALFVWLVWLVPYFGGMYLGMTG